MGKWNCIGIGMKNLKNAHHWFGLVALYGINKRAHLFLSLYPLFESTRCRLVRGQIGRAQCRHDRTQDATADTQGRTYCGQVENATRTDRTRAALAKIFELFLKTLNTKNTPEMNSHQCVSFVRLFVIFDKIVATHTRPSARQNSSAQSIVT